MRARFGSRPTALRRGRRDADTLFDIVDPTQSLTARGNLAGSGYSTYLTTYKPDISTGLSPNSTGGNTVCNGGGATANTGLLCETDAPSYDGTHATITRYTYDSVGQKATMTTPKAIAESLSGQYTYTYYSDSDKDLSGTTAAGGWLKGTTDPSGNFVAFAYDAEGHQVRSWDRNATAGMQLSSYPGTVSSPAQANFSESLYTRGADNQASTFASPWRYPLAKRDAIGTAWSAFTFDANGNPVGARAPRGTGGVPTSAPVCPQPGTGQTYDICSSYDPNDNLLTTLKPMEANIANYGAQKPTSYTYDAFDNRVSTTNPDGAVTVDQYDTVNRHTAHLYTRGAWVGGGSDPAGCRDSTGADAPIPAGRSLCTATCSHSRYTRDRRGVGGGAAKDGDRWPAAV